VLTSTYSFTVVVGKEADMIPGSTTKLTEATAVVAAGAIDAKTDIITVAGVGPLSTIRPNFGGGQFSGMLILIPTGALVINTSGNILVGITCAANRPVWLVYVKSLGKWLINSGV
jgi:hypothetical protein